MEVIVKRTPCILVLNLQHNL